MDKIVIEGNNRLAGTVTISGAKNAVLPIMAAAMLSDEPSRIHGVPPLADVNTMTKILRNLGAAVHIGDGTLLIEPQNYKGYTAPWKLVSQMRASICLLGPLVGKKRLAEISMPGGCVIGARPVDLHIKGIRALGADVKIEHGYIIAKAKRLRGAHIYLGGAFGSSVLATGNVMMAGALAEGRTVIENAACEPEVVDLANFLLKMGAKIKGIASHTLEVEGVKRLHGAEHTIIPDRIEAATFIAAAAATGSDITIRNARPEHLSAVIDRMRACGAAISTKDTTMRVRGGRTIKPVDVTTLPYPGFPTDMQAQMMALMSCARGISVITEKIYPDRFMHVGELGRMGAQIILEGESAIVKGVRSLSGANVMASDLRASAALVVAGLVARGRTDIHRVYHLDRGYDKIEKKLRNLGAKVWREKEEG